jgi:hypothetical protein
MPAKQEKIDITALTDAQLDAMSEEELEALKAANATPPDEDGKEKVDAKDDDSEEEVDEKDDDKGDVEDDEEEDDDADKGDDDEEEDEDDLDADALEALAAEGKAPTTVPYAALKKARSEAADLRTMLMAALGKTKVEVEVPAAEAPKRPEFDFKAANREYTKLLLAGKEDEALAKQDEIEAAREQIHAFDLQQARAEAEQRAVGHVQQSQITSSVQKVERRLYREFPFLDVKAKGHDAVAITAVNARARDLIKAGRAPADALREAGMAIGKRFAKLHAIDGKGKDGKPDGKDPRAKAAFERNTNTQLPPVGGKKGVEKRTEPRIVDISTMTDAQIDKLTPEELRLLKLGQLKR